jgi:hypothetical protein
MEQEFLSIKDFAARAGVSAQAIYKRLNNPDDELINWLKADGKQKMLAAAALSLFQKKEESTSCETNCQPVDNQLIAMLQEELRQKNEQIATLQRLLGQEQQLRLVADQRILMLESGNQEAEHIEQNTHQEEAPEEPPKRKRWWQLWK